MPFVEKESYRWLAEFEALQEAYKEQVDKTVIQICGKKLLMKHLGIVFCNYI